MRIPPNVEPPHPWKLAKTWTYYGSRREVLFYVSRYEWWDDKGECWKTLKAWTFGDDGWKAKNWPDKRPLYGLHNLVGAAPDATVCLFDCEEAADAGAQLLGNKAVALAWCGGGFGANKADYAPLRDRKVFYWGTPGKGDAWTRNDVIGALFEYAAELWIFDVSDMPAQWNAVDAVESDGWDTARYESWTRAVMPDGQVRLRRHDYGTEPARAAIAPPPEQPEVTPARPPPREHSDIAATAKHWSVAPWKSKLIFVAGKGDKETAIRCIENACMPLMYAPEWEGLLAWDELHQCVAATRPTPWSEQPLEWQDHHDTALECWYDRAGLHYGGMIRDAVNLVAHRNKFHPVQDYLNSLKWDGIARDDFWLTTYCGSPNDRLTNFCGAAFLRQAVARAMTPGVQAKNCLILFGAQDAGKSEILSRLGSPWYAVQHGNIGGDSTKAIEQCSKAWIIEMAELAKLRRTDDIESVKAFIATKEDTYRPAYARRVMTVQRCCVFAGTSNPTQVFNDPTGNVRWWPVQVCDNLDLDGIRRDRDQLWAEAVVRWRAGEKWWIEDTAMKALAAEATDRHAVVDEWMDVIAEWIDQPENRQRPGFTSSQIWNKAIGGEMAKFSRSEQGRIGDCMRRLGYDYGQLAVDDLLREYANDNAKQIKGWRKP